jgi:uncharacterized protein YggE
VRNSLSLPAVLIIAGITGIIFGYIAFGYNIPNASSQDNGTTRTITVSGDASRSLEPDRVVIFLSLEGETADATTALTAQQQAIARVQQALESVVDADSVEISSLTLSPSFDFDQSFVTEPVPSSGSYVLRAEIPITITLDQLPNVAKAIGDAGYSTGDIYNYYECEMDDETGECIGPIEYLADLWVVITVGPSPLKADLVVEYEEKAQELRSMLEDFGIDPDDIGPAEITTEPEGASQFNPFIGTREITSYQAFTQITVTTPIENMGKVLSVAEQEGAIPQSVRLSVSDSRMEEARRDLTLEALDMARDRADDIAASLGKEVKEVISVDVSTNVPINPYGILDTAFSYYLPSPGTKVTVTVSAEFEMG